MRIRRALLAVAAFALLAPAAPAQEITPPCTMDYCPEPITPQSLVEYAKDATEQPLVNGEYTLRKAAVAAYGEGAPTSCEFTVRKQLRFGTSNEWEFSGETSCTAALQQTGRARVFGPAGTYYGTSCSAFATTCRSYGFVRGNYTDVAYHVILVAPRGQGWLAPAGLDCSGAGTDRLECTL